jgi:hypothetical protein
MTEMLPAGRGSTAAAVHPDGRTELRTSPVIRRTLIASNTISIDEDSGDFDGYWAGPPVPQPNRTGRCRSLCVP